MLLNIVLFGLILFVVIILSLVFLTFNHIVQYFILKPSHYSYLRIVKKTWWTSILWTLVMIGSTYSLSILSDSIIFRISATLLFLAVLFGINALNQKRIISEDGAKNDYFKKSMIASFGVSFLIIIITFIVYFPNKIISVTDKAKFLTQIDFITTCDPALNSLNEFCISNGNLMYGLYNENNRQIVAFIQLTPSNRMELLKRFKFEKIDTSKMDSYSFYAMENKIKNTVAPIGIQTVIPKRVGLQDVFEFSQSNTAISMNIGSSFHFKQTFYLICDGVSQRDCSVQMIFDTKSNILLLVEDVDYYLVLK